MSFEHRISNLVIVGEQGPDAIVYKRLDGIEIGYRWFLFNAPYADEDIKYSLVTRVVAEDGTILFESPSEAVVNKNAITLDDFKNGNNVTYPFISTINVKPEDDGFNQLQPGQVYELQFQIKDDESSLARTYFLVKEEENDSTDTSC